MPKIVKKRKYDWKNFNFGKYYGYPECCIHEFEHFWIEKGVICRIPILHIPNNTTGFNPCRHHAKKILNNEIKIEDLIHNRQSPNKFPNQKMPADMQQEYDKYIKRRTGY